MPRASPSHSGILAVSPYTWFVTSAADGHAASDQRESLTSCKVSPDGVAGSKPVFEKAAARARLLMGFLIELVQALTVRIFPQFRAENDDVEFLSLPLESCLATELVEGPEDKGPVEGLDVWSGGIIPTDGFESR